MSTGTDPEHMADAADVSGASVSGVSGRYAVALFGLAKAAGALEAVEADFAFLEALIADSTEVRTVMESPLFSRAERAKVLAALAAAVKRGGAGFHPLTVNFLGVTAHNGRTAELSDIFADFRALLASERGEATAEVTSAKALSAEQADALRAKLREVAGGRDVQLDARVDKGILGGLIVKIGSRMIDSSLRTKLNNLQVAMKEVG